MHLDPKYITKYMKSNKLEDISINNNMNQLLFRYQCNFVATEISESGKKIRGCIIPIKNHNRESILETITYKMAENHAKHNILSEIFEDSIEFEYQNESSLKRFFQDVKLYIDSGVYFGNMKVFHHEKDLETVLN